MKKIYLTIIYIIGLVSCLAFRFVQMTQMTDSATGFLYSQYSDTNYMMYGLVLGFTVILVAVCLSGGGLPEKRGNSVVLGVFSIFMGLAAVIMSIQLVLGIKAEVGIFLYIISTILFAIFMLYYGYTQISGAKMMSGFAVIPVIFAGVRLAIVFLDYYGLAKTVDIGLEIIMLIVSLIFWHYFAKYSVDIKPKSTPRWLLGFALGASILCFAATVPTYYAEFFTTAQSVREIVKTSYFDLVTGIYILIFVICSAVSGKKANAVEE